MALTSAEKELAAAIGFDDEVCEIVKQHTGRPLDRLMSMSEDYQQRDADGLSVAVERHELEPLVEELQTKLIPRGYRAFWSEIHASNGAKKSEEVAILKTTDDYAIIPIRRTDGANYGVFMEDVINKLKEWETRCQFRIFGAGHSWVAILFDRLPENVCAFAEEIYEFCPDTVEQGVGLLNESKDPAMFDAARKLCPKLSAAMQEKLDEKKRQFQQMELPPQLREMLSGPGAFTTSTDMGVRLLAYSLKQSSQLFLWWD